MTQKIQTLTMDGWKDHVRIDDHSIVADRVLQVLTDGSVRPCAVATVREISPVKTIRNRITGIWTVVVPDVPALVIDPMTMKFSEDGNPLARIGVLHYPCRVKAYDSVNKNVLDSLGGEKEALTVMANAVAKRDVSSRWQKLGAAYALRYIHMWQNRYSGLYAPDEMTAAGLQAILTMTGQFSRIEKGNNFKVSVIETETFVPTDRGLINDPIQVFVGQNGNYVRAIRREVSTGLVFIA